VDFLTDAFISRLFFGSIIVAAVVELLFPLRPLSHRLGPRWLANIGLGAANILIARWLLPVTGAMLASGYGVGLFNHVSAPVWLQIVIGVLILDVMSYWVHRVMHMTPVLWRLHRIHHTDMDVDFTTGVRHHPFEGMVVLAINTAVIFAFGLSPLAVAAYQAGRAVVDILSHANIRLPGGLDRVLRWVVITPDMHRIHHSADQPETDSNYGTLLPWWDRLFGSYRADPALGQTGMLLGLEEWRNKQDLTISGLVLLPFRSAPDPDPESGQSSPPQAEG
jgi:sterol desaturase/sphingolipid hydroxylase (fatty acid hydroxylase superfamily)